MNQTVFCLFLLINMVFKSGYSSESPPSTQIITNTHSNKATENKTQETIESFSLMLSDAEQGVIAKATKDDRQESSEKSRHCYFLGGILYMSPTNWTLWLNEQNYSNESTIPGIIILNVNRDSAEIKTRSSKAQTGVWVKLNQTFCSHIDYALAGDQRQLASS